MLLFIPENKPWLRACVGSSFLLLAGYYLYRQSEYPHGGSWPGIVSGIAAAGLIVFLMCFGLIKRRYEKLPNSVQTWMFAHIYLGIFVLFLVFFHSGMRFNDWIAVLALTLVTIVVLSGLIGAALYTFIPKRFIYVQANKSASDLSKEMNQVIQSMTRTAAKRSAGCRKLCTYLLETEHPLPGARWRILFTYHPRRRRPNEEATIQKLTASIDPLEKPQVDALLSQWAELRTLHEQLIDKQRYVNLMATWLYVHVPVSFAMLLFVVIHIVAALHYRFW
jgi:hypothetical protein